MFFAQRLVFFRRVENAWVIGVAFIQGMLAGIGLVIAGVPLVGLWALIGMILCIIGYQLAIGWLHPKPELNAIEQK